MLTALDFLPVVMMNRLTVPTVFVMYRPVVYLCAYCRVAEHGQHNNC